MKPILLNLILLFSLFIFSCGHRQSKNLAPAIENLNAMAKELNAKFSNDVAYKSIMISFDESIGNTIMVKVLENPDSAIISEWFYINGKWELSAEKVFENDSINVPDRFFTLNTDYNLSKLDDIFSTAFAKLDEEKNINDGIVKSVNLLMGNLSKTQNKMDNFITQITIESLSDKKAYFLNFDAEGNYHTISE
jgi:hypothetical protein